MIHFSVPPPSSSEEALLDDTQKDVDAQVDFAKQKQRATELWENRKNKATDKALWESMESKLALAHPDPDRCQYCEHDRDTATEHFYPKARYPDKAFRWENYLRACFSCNTLHKSDRFAVFDPKGSANAVYMTDRKVHTAAPNDDALLINPRDDKPEHFFVLDPATGVFLVRPSLSARDEKRAEYTLNLLNLASEAALTAIRRAALERIEVALDRYTTLKNCATWDDFDERASTSVKAMAKRGQNFADEQQRLMRKFEDDLKATHPRSVWVQAKLAASPTHAKLAGYFDEAPELLSL